MNTLNADTNRVRQRKETSLPTQKAYTKNAVAVNPSAQAKLKQVNALQSGESDKVVDVNTRKEAQQTVRDLAANEGNSRMLILRLHDKELYRALGYSSFASCVKAELGWNRQMAYRRLTSAQVAAHLGHTTLTLSDKVYQNCYTFWAESWYAALAKLPEAEWIEASEEIKQLAISRKYSGTAAQFHEQGQITGAIVREVVERRLSEQEHEPVNILDNTHAEPLRGMPLQVHSLKTDAQTGALCCVVGNGLTTFNFRIELEELQKAGLPLRLT